MPIKYGRQYKPGHADRDGLYTHCMVVSTTQNSYIAAAQANVMDRDMVYICTVHEKPH